MVDHTTSKIEEAHKLETTEEGQTTAQLLKIKQAKLETLLIHKQAGHSQDKTVHN